MRVGRENLPQQLRAGELVLQAVQSTLPCDCAALTAGTGISRRSGRASVRSRVQPFRSHLHIFCFTLPSCSAGDVLCHRVLSRLQQGPLHPGLLPVLRPGPGGRAGHPAVPLLLQTEVAPACPASPYCAAGTPSAPTSSPASPGRRACRGSAASLSLQLHCW